MLHNTPNIVYHYCSLESFMSIIKNNTIRLTNISKSNDSSEICYCFDFFQNILKKAIKDFTRLHTSDEELKSYFNGININNLISRAIFNDSLIYYVACFSSEANLLSQWRGYADDGNGVAIGFYSTLFRTSSPSDTEKLNYGKIVYDINNIETDFHNYIIDKLELAYKENNFSAYEIAINKIVSTIVYNAVFIKNPAFKEENEWRLVFYPFGHIRNLLINHKSRDMSSNQFFYDRMLEPIECEKDYNGLKRGKISFRCTKDKIISYVDMNFEKIKKEILAEIVIGPKSNITDNDLKLFLLSNGYDLTKVKIRKSSSTYR